MPRLDTSSVRTPGCVPCFAVHIGLLGHVLVHDLRCYASRIFSAEPKHCCHNNQRHQACDGGDWYSYFETIDGRGQTRVVFHSVGAVERHRYPAQLPFFCYVGKAWDGGERDSASILARKEIKQHTLCCLISTTLMSMAAMHTNMTVSFEKGASGNGCFVTNTLGP